MPTPVNSMNAESGFIEAPIGPRGEDIVQLPIREMSLDKDVHR